MFHAFDNPPDPATLGRQDWIALLARAPAPLLESALAEQATREPHWLRRPETGLMMVQGRAGGTGERFNLGEVTVTRCALRPAAERSHAGARPVGVAYVLGRDHRRAQLAALADALLQDPAFQRDLEATLIEPVRRHLAGLEAQRQARAQASRVDFFTVARESSSPGAEVDDE